MRARGGRTSTTGMASALLWLGTLQVSPVQDGDVPVNDLPVEHAQDLRAVLLRDRALESPTRAELASRLAALGPAAVPSLYALATGNGLAELIGGEWVPEAWHCLPEEIPALSSTALGLAPIHAVCAEFERALDQEPTFQERIVMLRILGAQRSADGLALVLRNASEFEPLDFASQGTQPALREALTCILRHDARSWDLAEKALGELEPETITILAEVLGGSGKARGMDLLERMLRLESLDPAFIAECMAHLEEARPWDLGGRTLEVVTPWLRSLEADRRALAARLAGRLRGLAAVPTLIELARDADPQVHRCALGALEAMAGHPLEPDPVALDAWFAREEAWKEARWSELHETVLRGPPGVAKEALREFARHPLYLPQAAGMLAADLLEAQSSNLVLCIELERIGSRLAVPGLLASMERGESRLRAAAWRALRAITGEDRELSSELWRQFVDS